MYRNDSENEFVNSHYEQRSLAPLLWGAISSAVALWWADRQLSADVMKERRALAMLPDHLLRDVGIHRADAMSESRRGGDDLPLARQRRLVC